MEKALVCCYLKNRPRETENKGVTIRVFEKGEWNKGA